MLCKRTNKSEIKLDDEDEEDDNVRPTKKKHLKSEEVRKNQFLQANGNPSSDYPVPFQFQEISKMWNLLQTQLPKISVIFFY